MGLLTPDQIRRHLKSHPGWAVARGKLAKTYSLKDFREALGFINKVGEIAEAVEHHPDIHLTDCNKVQLQSVTHDEGGITERDFLLLRKLKEKGLG
ncbi:MAG: 4a-hydroxytetrahydrobiopterin dehydratase [Halobacteria archaeon]